MAKKFSKLIKPVANKAAPTKAAPTKAAPTTAAPKAQPLQAAPAPTLKSAAPAKAQGHPRYAKMPLAPNVRLYATVNTNPRRAPMPGENGTKVGYHMMEALIQAGNKGLTWTEYKKLGGRSEDIRWDVARGWARYEAPKQDQDQQ